MRNFALTGAGGFVAPRHFKAIHDSGHRLIAACDPNDSVGVLDQYSFDVRFFTEFERFDRYLDKVRRGPEEGRVHYLSVCSPNYLHDAHCRLGLRVGADVICEKPLVINPWNLDALAELEEETGHRVWNILQLRAHDRLVALREELFAKRSERGKHEVELTYITSRGPWYDQSWKGSPERSGGVPTNIGIHFFDMLLWMFGAFEGAQVHMSEARRMAGFLELERARVKWFLSVDHRDLPSAATSSGKKTFRTISVDGTEVEFSEGFTDLHTRVYQLTVAGKGFGIADAKPSIQLAHTLRGAAIESSRTDAHPFLRAGA